MRHAPKLTSRQRVIRFIQTFWAEYYYAPTVQEIANGLGFGSRNAAIYHIRALRALGTVEWTEGPERTIKLKEVSVAVAGGAKSCFDMQVVDGKVNRGTYGLRQNVETDVDKAVEKLLEGKLVFCHAYETKVQEVRLRVEAELERRASA